MPPPERRLRWAKPLRARAVGAWTNWQFGRVTARLARECRARIGFSVVRGGNIVGEHSVMFGI